MNRNGSELVPILLSKSQSQIDAIIQLSNDKKTATKIKPRESQRHKERYIVQTQYINGSNEKEE